MPATKAVDKNVISINLHTFFFHNNKGYLDLRLPINYLGLVYQQQISPIVLCERVINPRQLITCGISNLVLKKKY